MKKIIALFATAALATALAVSATGCSSGSKVKTIDVTLTGEEYGYCVNNDSDATIMTAVNQLITDLCGDEPFDPDNGAFTANGVSYDFNGDGTAENVTFKTIYDAVTGGTANDVGEFPSSVPSGKTRSECLVVATNAEFEPFEYLNGNKYAGIDMWIAKILADTLGKTLVIKNMDFEVVITDVENGDSDIGMAGLTINHGREEHVTFSSAYYTTTQRIAVLESNTDFANCTTEADVRAVIESYGSVKAGAAAGQTGYFYLSGSTDFEFDGFSNVTVKSYDSIGLAVQDLSNGKVKFVVGDKDTIESAVEAINGKL